MRIKPLVGAALALGALAATASPAMAVPTGSGSVTPNVGLVNNQTVTINYSGFTAGVPVSIQQCGKSITAGDFDESIWCSPTWAKSVSSPSGSTTFQVHTGPATDFQPWACLTTDNPVDFPVSPNCYIRMTSLNSSNVDDDIEFLLSFQSVGANVPEVPYAVLLPLGALGAVGTAMFLNRRRAIA